jgi:hypothetical protein
MGAFENTRSKLLFVNTGKLLAFNGEGNAPTEYKGWKGYLTNVTFKEIPAKPEKNIRGYEAINIHLDDGQEPVIITCKFNSGYGRSFAKAIGNADLSKEIAVVPQYVEENGQKNGSIMINQDGTILKWMWTNANPGDCPPAEKFEFNDQQVVDYKKQLVFLKDFLLNVVVPQLGGVPSSAHALMQDKSDIEKRAEEMASNYTPPQRGSAAPDDELPVDDLPF